MKTPFLQPLSLISRHNTTLNEPRPPSTLAPIHRPFQRRDDISSTLAHWPWVMPPHSSTYSPLEILLIFQSLTAQPLLPSTFDNVSELLKTNKFIRDGPGFDVAKVAPDALRDLYLGTIRDEVKSQAVVTGERNGVGDDGDEQHGSKKRRLESPDIETVEDAEKYRDRLPRLVEQFYVEYRNEAIEEIVREEGRIMVLEAELRRLEREAAEESQRGVNGGSSKEAEPALQSKGVQEGPADPGREISSRRPSETPPTSVSNDVSTKPGTVQSGSTKPSGMQEMQVPNQQPVTRAESSVENGTETRSASVPSESHPQPFEGITPRGTPGQPPMVGPVGVTPNYLPPQQPVQSYPQPSPPLRPPNLPLGQPQTQGPDASPSRSFALPPNAPPRSPVILPPPLGMPMPSGSPPMPRGAVPDMASPNPRTPSGPALQMQYYPPTQQPGRPIPSHMGYPPQPYPPYPGQQTPYSKHVSPYGNQQYPLQPMPSRALPLPKGTPQDQSNIPRQIKGTPQQQFPAYPNRPTPQGFIPNQVPPYVNTPFGQGQTPMNRGQFYDSSGPPKRETPRPLMLDTSFLSTPWKTPDRGFATTDPGSPTPPEDEDVSPISERAVSPLEAVGEKVKTGRKPARGGKRGDRGGPARQLSPKTEPGSRARRNQRDSTASSAARSRSQSLISHQEDSQPPTRPSAARKWQQEAPSTPAGILTDDNNDADISTFSKDNTPQTTTRRKPPALLADTTVTRATSKRKRDPRDHDSADYDSSPPITSTFPRPYITQNPSQVLTTRNFTRTCQHLMNEVTAHKHASIFAKPLTERDAPGYKDLIYRPTDLKTIKSAIHSGSRAVAAASESVSTPPAGEAGSPPSATPTSKNSVLNLAKTADLIPPKGIVNSAQLEKELMRMFANAIMFNPNPTNERGFGPAFQLQRDVDWKRLTAQHNDDEDSDEEDVTIQAPSVSYPLGYQRFDDGGIVNDTREMFEDVERAVREWRNAERGNLNFGPEDFGMRGSVSAISAKGKGSLVERDSVVDDSMDELGEPIEVGSGGGVKDEESGNGTGVVAGRKRRRGGE
jgi:hypothetical protein